jgi:hypothetical protein
MPRKTKESKLKVVGFWREMLDPSELVDWGTDAPEPEGKEKDVKTTALQTHRKTFC